MIKLNKSFFDDDVGGLYDKVDIQDLLNEVLTKCVEMQGYAERCAEYFMEYQELVDGEGDDDDKENALCLANAEFFGFTEEIVRCLQYSKKLGLLGGELRLADEN